MTNIDLPKVRPEGCYAKDNNRIFDVDCMKLTTQALCDSDVASMCEWWTPSNTDPFNNVEEIDWESIPDGSCA